MLRIILEFILYVISSVIGSFVGFACYDKFKSYKQRRAEEETALEVYKRYYEK